jgi:hypothetical protein
MAEKNFLSWVGFRDESDRTPVANPLDRIRELEAQLSDLRSRRDITSLSKEEFEILATETAMMMVKSAQAREVKAHAAADRLISESTRNAKDAIEAAENKARSILSGAESRGRKYISAAEAEASEMIAHATREAEAVADVKRREAAALALAARREGERIIAEATSQIEQYQDWMSDVVAESERLYRVQAQALSAAEQAIAQSRDRLEGAFKKLSDMQTRVSESINADGTVNKAEPIKVESRRTARAIEAPAKKRPAKKAVAKKSVAKKTAAKRK